MKKIIEYLLFKSDVSNYQISKKTGISQVVLGKYTNGKSEMGRMTLDNALKLKKFFEEWAEMNKKQFGTVVHKGKEVVLTEEASLNFAQGIEGVPEDHYSARAVDREGNSYMVYWKPVKNWEKFEDAELHCEWDNPIKVELIG